MTPKVDILILGAGPAGATAARLLALQGRSVLLLRGPASRNPHAGSLPPTIAEVFRSIGVLDAIEQANFYPDLGVVRWWLDAEAEVESYGEGSRGYHVQRHALDELLLTLAESAGVEVQRNSRAPRVELDRGIVEHDGGVTEARFVLDATGRAGLIARQIRRFWDPRYRTVGLCGLLRASETFDADPHYNLMEAYDRGWAWSVPLSPRCRYVCFYVDASIARDGETQFRAELARTVEFQRLFGDAELESPPWVRDSSLYYSERYAGTNWMLMGDAASFVDPLSSSGVEKALLSAQFTAEAIGRCLDRPAEAGEAIRSMNAREARVWREHAESAARTSAAMLDLYDTPFWRDRAKPPEL